MNSQPNNTKTSSAKKANPFEVLGKAISKFVILFRREIILKIEAKWIFIMFLIDINSLFLSVFGLALGISFLIAV